MQPKGTVRKELGCELVSEARIRGVPHEFVLLITVIRRSSKRFDTIDNAIREQ